MAWIDEGFLVSTKRLLQSLKQLLGLSRWYQEINQSLITIRNEIVQESLVIHLKDSVTSIHGRLMSLKRKLHGIMKPVDAFYRWISMALSDIAPTSNRPPADTVVPDYREEDAVLVLQYMETTLVGHPFHDYFREVPSHDKPEIPHPSVQVLLDLTGPYVGMEAVNIEAVFSTQSFPNLLRKSSDQFEDLQKALSEANISCLVQDGDIQMDGMYGSLRSIVFDKVRPALMN
jgi:hypothetical protein